MKLEEMRRLRTMGKKEREKKLHELKMELVKSGTHPTKANTKTKEIKKTIARLLMLNKSEKK